MKAIVVSEFGDETVLKYQEIEKPEPQDEEVRIQMKAIGVNPVETYIRMGKYSIVPDLPYTPGNDGAGIIDKVGKGVTRFSKGDRVFTSGVSASRNTGTYAEYAVLDADAVQLLPENISFEEGASLGTPGLAAVNALYYKAKIRGGETVLIHGASGGVGSVAVQLAKRAGAIVIGTAGDENGLEEVKKLGATYVFNHREEGYTEKIIEAAGGSGPNVIIEMATHVNLMKDVDMIAKRGRIVAVGSGGSLEFDPRGLMTKDATVYGMNIANMKKRNYKSAMYILLAALESGLETEVGETMPLEQAAQAHRDIAEKKKTGKIILTIEESKK